MSETNPIAFADSLRSVLARYIATTLPISRRYPILAAEFRKVLSQEQLVRGPYVEALPDFEKGQPLSMLLQSAGGFLHDGLGLLPTAGRKLHLHQEEALRRAVVGRESFLTATGTGSGKTETFLFPIVHDLLSDPDPSRPGVRALLIYPMNALANDQLYYRVAPIFAGYLKQYGITFGRYTGQVKSNAKRDEEESRLWNNPKLMEALGHPSSIPKNWLLTRDEMLANPPKVLITNYAMLEHLLLLPRNAGLFATNSLRTIVLDEIHTYYGAQATEVAFLLRKLKTRLAANGPIQAFGTSASLSSAGGADEELKKFASDLLGEPVTQVIRGKRITHADLVRPINSEFSFSAEQWVLVGQVLKQMLEQQPEDQTADCWNVLVGTLGDSFSRLRLASAEGDLAWKRLVDVFACNREIRKVAATLEGGQVVPFAQLAGFVFDSFLGDHATRESALSHVIQIGMLARRDSSEFPLLPGRYHIAVNSIEGLMALPSPSKEGWSQVRAGRSYSDDEGQYFPILTCRKCGQPFLEGWKEGGYVHTTRPDSTEANAERMVFWLGKPINGTEDEQDEVEGRGEADTTTSEHMFVEIKTGEILATESAVPLYPVKTEKDDLERAIYVKRCPACGGRSTGADAEVVTRMHPGNEALGAVVAQRVLEALPPGVIDNADPRPSFGRTLLTFSDNRQDAAFFAPYFERTSANLALRAAVRHVLAESSTPMTLPQMAERVYELWRRDGGQPLLLDESGDIRTDKQDISQLLQGALGYEFCTPSGRRNSLESLGIAFVTYDDARLKLLYQQVAKFWPTALPNDSVTIVALCHFLLESIRRERALAQLHDVSMNDSAVWGDYNQHRTFDVEAGDDAVKFKWLPSQQTKRHNRRSWYLIEQLGLERDASSLFLRQFWEAVSRPPTTLLKKYPPGFGMDGNLIRIKSGLKTPVYQCPGCGLFQRHVVKGKCSGFGCSGEVVLIGEEERVRLHRENHYLASYEEANHLTLRAREHTASLSTELREEIEREFSERRLNLLSCTTTMEMGVDLGDLEAVVNLNVPPGIANYQQRTGRAGRRAQAAPFCVTVARNSSYDQAVFRDLQSYLVSSPATPFINLGNAELFLRHQVSVVLSHFLRHSVAKQDINAPSLKHLFGDVLSHEAKVAFFDKLYAWAEDVTGQAAFAEAEALGDRLPADLAKSVVSRGPVLRSAIFERFREFAEDVAERCAVYIARMKEFADASEYGRADFWKKQREQYMDQFLVNELSRRGLIPTYSFPVHSLTLEVQNGTRFNTFQSQAAVALSRDASYGISEYAPGAEVVANGRIWESAGLAKYPKAFMPTRWYAACPECFYVDVGDLPEDVPKACSICGSSDGRQKRMYIEPKGFVTSAAESKGRDPGSSRRRVKPADEARLIAAPRADQFEATELSFLNTALLLARGSEGSDVRGSLFVANRGMYGEGYFRCSLCNLCGPFRKAKAARAAKVGKNKTGGAAAIAKWVHKDPATGLTCKKDEQSKSGLDFAHTFNTDVRLLRFLERLPERDDVPEVQRRYQEQVARTIAEACRLGASDLLHLHPGELRSTYRLYSTAGSLVEVVLYDGVPGGAGYSARLGQPQFSFTALMQAARLRLECPASCDSACRSCLCDYGNQRYWDSFQRRDALAWLDRLLEGKVGADGPGNYMPWAKPTLAGLNDRFAPYASITVIAPSLTGAEGYSEADLNLVLSWLQEGKSVRLCVANAPEKAPTEYSVLMLYRYLYPWAAEGRLKVLRLPNLERLASEVPRAFAALNDGAPLVKQAFPVQGVFQGLVNPPALLGASDAEVRAKVEAALKDATEYPASLFADGSSMSMWELGVGQPRDLANIFGDLAGLHIKRLTIRDPYCGTPYNQRRLQELLQFMQRHSTALDTVHVYCAEVRDRDGDIEHRFDIARRLELMIGRLGISSSEAFVKELGRNSRAFHDRELNFSCADASGREVVHRYFLTGGIDYLLDERSDTRVFHSRMER
jgi:hypothetical protein